MAEPFAAAALASAALAGPASSTGFKLELDDVFTPDPGTEDMLVVPDNRFAFEPGQLSKPLNPKSLDAFYAMGGLSGIEKGLGATRQSGLSAEAAAPQNLDVKDYHVNGRHGDIKPENILFFNGKGDGRDGMIQITDFGFGRIHKEASRSARHKQGNLDTATYRPPETDLYEALSSRRRDPWPRVHPINTRTRFNQRLRNLSCWEVPGRINGVKVHALPDWGSSLDTISEFLAIKHSMHLEPTEPKAISLPGGGKAVSIARVLGRFKFQGERQVHKRYFYVLQGTSPYDVVLGRSFLDETKTLTDFSHRIVERSRVCVQRGDRLCFLGETPEVQGRIQCSVNGIQTSALPDTGSDLMFVSGEFARRNGWKIFRGKRYRRQVQRIDGSLVRTDGMVFDAELQFDIPSTKESGEMDYKWFIDHAEGLASLIGDDMKGSLASGKMTFICDLHVIEGLPCDIILSNEFIFNKQVFSRFRHLFSSSSSMSDNEQACSHQISDEMLGDFLLFMRMKDDKFSRLFSRQQRQPRPPSPPNTASGANSNKNNYPLQAIASVTIARSPQTQAQTQPEARRQLKVWQGKWDDEESRRNLIQLRIESLPEPLRTQEEQAEQLRRADWDRRNPHPGLQSA